MRSGTVATLKHYDYMVQPFLDWLRREQPEVRRFEDLEVAVVRGYPAVWRPVAGGMAVSWRRGRYSTATELY